MNDIIKSNGEMRGTAKRSIHPGSGRRKAAPFAFADRFPIDAARY